jgi:hypothetical protein
MGANSTKLPNKELYGEQQDIIQIVLLAHGFDRTSLFNIPKDLIGNILQWYDRSSVALEY